MLERRQKCKTASNANEISLRHSPLTLLSIKIIGIWMKDADQSNLSKFSINRATAEHHFLCFFGLSINYV